jgi:hypothetical protein
MDQILPWCNVPLLPEWSQGTDDRISTAGIGVRQKTAWAEPVPAATTRTLLPIVEQDPVGLVNETLSSCNCQVCV